MSGILVAKIGDYLAAGIPYVWVIDPYKRTVVEATRSGIRKVTSQKLSTPLVGEVDFAELFAQLGAPANNSHTSPAQDRAGAMPNDCEKNVVA